MSLRFDPAGVQLLFADLQEEIVARSRTNPPDALAASTGVLVELASVFALPVVVSAVPEGGKAPSLTKELARSRATPFVRTGADPFNDGDTLAAVERNARRTIVVAGFATEVVVLHAAASAISRGYRVIAAVDACGGMSERTEAAAFRQIAALGAETSSVVTIATALEPDFTSDRGQRMFAALQQLRLA